jgi:hypothetical protein
LLRSASERSLGDSQYAIRLGLALAMAGDAGEGSRAWGRAVALHPEFLGVLPYHETGISIEAVAAEARRIIGDEPRPAPVENMVKLWEIGLALDDLPADAGAAWRAVDDARHGRTELAAALAAAAVAEAPYDPRGWEAVAAVATFACDIEEQERAADALRTLGTSSVVYESRPQIWREFVYREASLGPSQPPDTGPALELEPWPWSLIAQPTGCDG